MITCHALVLSTCVSATEVGWRGISFFCRGQGSTYKRSPAARVGVVGETCNVSFHFVPFAFLCVVCDYYYYCCCAVSHRLIWEAWGAPAFF